MKTLVVALLAAVPLFAMDGVEFKSLSMKPSVKIQADEPILQPAPHELAGTYADPHSYSTVVIDQYGRITNDFEVTVATGDRWLVRFPQRLKKSEVSGNYWARGTIYGLWSNGLVCHYPVSVMMDATEDAQLIDATFKFPSHFMSDCRSYGETVVQWGLEKIK